jgi:hypothetical protein
MRKTGIALGLAGALTAGSLGGCEAFESGPIRRVGTFGYERIEDNQGVTQGMIDDARAEKANSRTQGINTAAKPSDIHLVTDTATMLASGATYRFYPSAGTYLVERAGETETFKFEDVDGDGITTMVDLLHYLPEGKGSMIDGEIMIYNEVVPK